jgi:nicotinamide-nucleotide amidase
MIMPEAPENQKWPANVAQTLGELLAELLRRGQTVASAESCTGGLVATALTHLPGTSAVYLGGVSSYANEAKTTLLGVETRLLATVGAVSPEVAKAMAEGARARLGATWAVGITGIAGPTGGSREKPVGLVYVGVAGPGRSEATRLDLSGDREAIRLAAARQALFLLQSAVQTW